MLEVDVKGRKGGRRENTRKEVVEERGRARVVESRAAYLLYLIEGGRRGATPRLIGVVTEPNTQE